MTDRIIDAGVFHWPVLIWPAALIIFLAFFFRRYHQDIKQPSSALKKPPKPSRLSLLGRPGRMTKRDCFLALALTLAYGALAFAFSGSVTAPQTFWSATLEQPTLTLDLGEDVWLDNILYYTGRGLGIWTLELSPDGLDWHTQPYMSHYYFEVFRWKIPLFEEDYSLPTRYIRITALPDGNNTMELGELGLIVRGEDGKRALMDTAPLASRRPEYAALFDEQAYLPAWPDLDNNTMFSQPLSIETYQGTLSNLRNGMIHDECLHARSAYDFIRNFPPLEITHPPLGKIIITLGVKLFGMTAFGWRFMGILFGILMIPLIYMLVKNLFDSTTVAFCGAALFAFENMHYTQTHIATIDSYVVLFILMMYLFMYRYISSGYDAPFKKTLPALFLCGLSFGLGTASKWTAIYAALGLIVLYMVYLVKRGRHQAAAGRKKEYRVFLFRTLAASVVFFVVIPLLIYTLSYIPYTTANGQHLTAGGLLRDMWNNQVFMLNYHRSQLVDTPQQSRWYEWMLDIKPALYYSRYQENDRTIFAAFTNPLVTIGGLAALCIALYDFFRQKGKGPFFIVVGYLSQLAPWILIRRTTFVYHYFPSMIFLTLAICYVFHNILKHHPEHKWWVYAFTGASVALFFLLLPPTAGLSMPNWYSAWFVRWLPSWQPL